MQTTYKTIITAGILLGIGGAGFFDGIVFHQILQWHQMLTSTLPTLNLSQMKINTHWDGIFNGLMYLVTATGIYFLWRAGQQQQIPTSSPIFPGSLLLGAGLFNLIEGLINHQILGIHHVKEGPNYLSWDLGFLAVNFFILVYGWLLLERGKNNSQTT
jgi:uncharacterized membrane protein